MVRINTCIGCQDFPCQDVQHEHYILPQIDINPEKIAMVMISEAAPKDPEEYYYAGGPSSFQKTTIQAFQSAGVQFDSFSDLLEMGIYFTTAVKCGKTGYGIKAAPIKNCSFILEDELNLFPHIKSILLMGDVAIKSINYISKRSGEGRAIPAGSTYKIRGREFFFRGIRAFPSYLQVGPSFGIEKSKMRMIGEDIAAAVAILV